MPAMTAISTIIWCLAFRLRRAIAPYRILNGPFKGYDYAEVSAKVGYEMGRLTPYLYDRRLARQTQ